MVSTETMWWSKKLQTPLGQWVSEYAEGAVKMSTEEESLVVIMTLSLSLSLHNNYQSFRHQPGTPTHASSELRELGEFKQNFTNIY